MEKNKRLGKNTNKALQGAFAPLRSKVRLTPGRAIRIYREAQGFSQLQLAERSGLNQSTISALESDRITLGLDRAKVLARALKVHPSVLAFPHWDIDEESAA